MLEAMKRDEEDLQFVPPQPSEWDDGNRNDAPHFKPGSWWKFEDATNGATALVRIDAASGIARGVDDTSYDHAALVHDWPVGRWTPLQLVEP